MRTLAPAITAATASLVWLAACAPILSAPGPASLFPETPAESPSPSGIGQPLDRFREVDTERLRATGLLLPVKGVLLGKVEDSFDAPRDDGRRHDAVDILAPRGTPILAATDGTVLRIGTNTLGGNVIWMVDPDERFAFYYAHIDRYARGIKQGDRIGRGTVIGYVGTTGNSPRHVPHLHFQLMRISDIKRWSSGTPLNPLPFLMGDAGVTRASPEMHR